MNYTRPNNEGYKDSPEDWLNSALIFSRTISLLLEENEGVVVSIKGDAINPINPKSDRVVVFYKDKQIHIDDIQDPNLKEGDFIRIVEEN
jgi:hypothetical protein